MNNADFPKSDDYVQRKLVNGLSRIWQDVQTKVGTLNCIFPLSFGRNHYSRLFFQRFWGRLEQPKAAPMLSFEGKSEFFGHFLSFFTDFY